MPKILLVVLLFAFSLHLNAQKLPNKQEQSVWLPDNVKIDGKADEWGGTFKAYNKAVDVFYTIANDDKNIYLIVKAQYKDVIDKILRGGLTVRITGSNKNDKNGVSITYPMLEGQDMWVVANKFNSISNRQKDGEVIKVSELNDLFYTKEKTIKVTGMAGIPDQAISIYNTDGIKAVSLFDDKVTYTYELALPIVYLKLADNDAVRFKYHFKINEAPEVKRPAVITASTPPPPPPIQLGTVATTDFWGEYTLAKKP